MVFSMSGKKIRNSNFKTAGTPIRYFGSDGRAGASYLCMLSFFYAIVQNATPSRKLTHYSRSM